MILFNSHVSTSFG